VLLLFPDHQSFLLTVAVLFIGQALLSLLITVVLIGIGGGTENRRRLRICVANGVGMLLLVVFIFAYYAVYDISLPFSSELLEVIAAFIIAACALGAAANLPTRDKVDLRVWAVPLTALILLLFPAVRMVVWQEPKAVPGNGFPVRVMTYNLHNGFSVRGHLNMEALARVIEDSNPDIVALQEVSRGWLVNGRVDMLTWLSQRLDMPYVFGPTTGPLWGNAILSRYRVVEFSQQQLPPYDLLLSRGFISAQVDLGNGVEFQFIVTHYHHPATTALEGDSDIRVLQSKAILDFWDGSTLTAVLGDFNGQVGDPEIEMLREGGLVDAAGVAESHPAPTWPSDSPRKRIDYIWVSPDLGVVEVNVPVSTASDHLPVVVVIYR
jgi:endonuclease/exonuclease/phosphatase family metal-dependent hydrolase